MRQAMTACGHRHNRPPPRRADPKPLQSQGNRSIAFGIEGGNGGVTGASGHISRQFIGQFQSFGGVGIVGGGNRALHRSIFPVALAFFCRSPSLFLLRPAPDPEGGRERKGIGRQSPAKAEVVPCPTSRSVDPSIRRSVGRSRASTSRRNRVLLRAASRRCSLAGAAPSRSRAGVGPSAHPRGCPFRLSPHRRHRRRKGRARTVGPGAQSVRAVQRRISVTRVSRAYLT